MTKDEQIKKLRKKVTTLLKEQRELQKSHDGLKQEYMALLRRSPK